MTVGSFSLHHPPAFPVRVCRALAAGHYRALGLAAMLKKCEIDSHAHLLSRKVVPVINTSPLMTSD